MYLDVLASRLGMHDASDEALRVELNRYSLKTPILSLRPGAVTRAANRRMSWRRWMP
jgi:hypothetical protein